jgi:pantoate--beta-alanine ligase
MLILESIKELQGYRSSLPNDEKIGLIPTMGALHKGHLSLLAQAKEKSTKTLVSIFVNPLQFNNSSDFIKYPIKTTDDLALLQQAGCDVVFMPKAEEMYRETPTLSFEFGTLTQHMEGEFRPGHFNGVAIIVSKLLHITKPHYAFFGEKDLQQLRVIECLVRDLAMDVDVVPCPTLREQDGLAMSSRNMRLNAEQRKRALLLNEYLQLAKRMLGLKSHTEIEKQIHIESKRQALIALEYLSIVDQSTLLPCANPLQTKDVAICIAALVDEIRLIDNIIVSS